MPFKGKALERTLRLVPPVRPEHPPTTDVRFAWAQKSTASSGGALMLAALCSLVLIIASASPITAQPANTRDLNAYSNAVSQVRTADRIAALEQFVSTSHSSMLAIDALEVLVWDHLRTGDLVQAGKAAHQLATADPGNVLAAAVTTGAAASNQSPAQALGMATEALGGLDRLRKPEGMSDNEFAVLNQQVAAILHGAIGLGDLQVQNYMDARTHLRQAVAFFPENAQYAYALGAADLTDPSPDAAEGFWYLARAVNLTRGTSASQQISDYARAKYVKAGGTPEAWAKFVLAATTATPQPQPRAVAATVSPSAPRSSAAAAVRRGQPVSTENKTAVKTTQRRTNAKSKPPQSRSKRQREEAEQAELNKMPEIPAPEPKPRPRSVATPGAPVSIGILVESGSITKSTRNAMVYGLSDIVRHLRPGDEAFIMSFSNQLDFEQDLTGNYRLLEQAMDHIRPQPGTALYDAVAFGAGHLKRIAKNNNRVLLVISDGTNRGGRASPLEVAAGIDEVKIFCIGMDVSGAEGRNLLSALASRTGGQVSFISDPKQFREATGEIAESLGIGGPF